MHADFLAHELTISDDYFKCRDEQEKLTGYYSQALQSSRSRLFYIAASSKDGCLDRLIVELTDAVRVDSRLEDEVYRVKGDYYIKWTPVDGRGFYSLIKE